MIFGKCTTCIVKCCEQRCNDGLMSCIHYYNPNIDKLQRIMMLNENYYKEVKAAPNCPFNEVKALELWFLDCAKQWLDGYKKEVEQLPTVDDMSIEFRDDLLTMLDELLASLCVKETEVK